MTHPADFFFVYEWDEGPLPPPHHYEFKISVGPGATGKIVFYPDYPGDDNPEWDVPIEVTREPFAELSEVCLVKCHRFPFRLGC